MAKRQVGVQHAAAPNQPDDIPGHLSKECFVEPAGPGVVETPENLTTEMHMTRGAFQACGVHIRSCLADDAHQHPPAYLRRRTMIIFGYNLLSPRAGAACISYPTAASNRTRRTKTSRFVVTLRKIIPCPNYCCYREVDAHQYLTCDQCGHYRRQTARGAELHISIRKPMVYLIWFEGGPPYANN